MESEMVMPSHFVDDLAGSLTSDAVTLMKEELA